MQREIRVAEPEPRLAAERADRVERVPGLIRAAPAALLDAVPPAGIAVAPAADGTTNALALADASLFQPLYGPGSAERFLALVGQAVTVEHPNLAHDVDTLEDLRRYELRTGPRTQMALAMAGLACVA